MNKKEGIGGLEQYDTNLYTCGNTVPTSFFRTVLKKETPAHVCWRRNKRSFMVREPIGCSNKQEKNSVTNPYGLAAYKDGHGRQTVEIRSVSGSALFYLNLAWLAIYEKYVSTEIVLLSR